MTDPTPHNPDPLPPNTTPKGADFDPHLKAVMEEIKELLNKHQVGGYVVLQSPHYAEYLLSFPAWTCIALAPDGGRVRIYAKREQFPSLEAQIACVEASTGMLLQLETMLIEHAAHFAAIGEVLGQHFDISHISRHFPGNPQS